MGKYDEVFLRQLKLWDTVQAIYLLREGSGEDRIQLFREPKSRKTFSPYRPSSGVN